MDAAQRGQPPPQAQHPAERLSMGGRGVGVDAKLDRRRGNMRVIVWSVRMIKTLRLAGRVSRTYPMRGESAITMLALLHLRVWAKNQGRNNAEINRGNYLSVNNTRIW